MVTLQQPSKVVFGAGAWGRFTEDYLALGLGRLYVLTTPPVREAIEPGLEALRAAGTQILVDDTLRGEPTLGDMNGILARARDFGADSVVGVGGGSVLDVAKLAAVLIGSSQRPEELFGMGKLASRGVWIAAVPTTAGTGSEVSPNAILLDEAARLKQGIVSPFLLADAAYIDPELTYSVPAKITAETGMDALTHCIEAYTNANAHPVVDVYALEGIRLIATHLLRAVRNGSDKQAREALALGSYYGGLVLAPVNTAAVHALSYPLGGEFHIPHGLANAILLAPVMEFNLPANVAKHAAIARACGVSEGKTPEETAQAGVEAIRRLTADCGIAPHLSQLGIREEDIPAMARAGVGVTRLMKNNPRSVSVSDAEAIYKSIL